MTISISPNFTDHDFTLPWTLDVKIKIFIDRITGWQLNIAYKVANTIPHSDLATLQILFCYFEMIGKYVEGYVGENKSQKFFKIGILYTFPEVGFDQNDEIIEMLYKFVRNGLYHLGKTGSNVIISNYIPGSFGNNMKENLLALSPVKLVDDIMKKFNEYAALLIDKQNTRLRENFEKRFDFDNY